MPGYDGKLAYTQGIPGQFPEINNVLKGAWLSSLGTGIVRPAQIDSVSSKVIKVNQDVTITITGSNLVGNFFIANTQINHHILPVRVRARVTNEETRFADLTEVQVTYRVTPQDIDNYELFVKSDGGDSNRIAGFTIVA